MLFFYLHDSIECTRDNCNHLISINLRTFMSRFFFFFTHVLRLKFVRKFTRTSQSNKVGMFERAFDILFRFYPYIDDNSIIYNRVYKINKKKTYLLYKNIKYTIIKYCVVFTIDSAYIHVYAPLFY